MNNKPKKPKDQVNHLCKEILETILMWKAHAENGCSDPFWEDGANMTLLRNHVIYYRYNIRILCEEQGIPLPWEYYLPAPPEVPSTWMADMGSERAQKFMKEPRYSGMVSFPVRYQSFGRKS